MAKPYEVAIHEQRRRLGNPYAYIDELEELQALRQARLKLENPYAHQEDVDRIGRRVARFDGLSQAEGQIAVQIPGAKASRRYSDREIEDRATTLLREMWEARDKIFDGDAPTEPLAIVDPAIALKFLGYEFDVLDTLGQFVSSGRLTDVAGTIDQGGRRVQISAQCPPSFRYFTAAHELGHAVLHEGSTMHRDRPLDGSVLARERQEYEADKFASCFLMPRKQLVAAFERLFGRAPFALRDDTLFALFGSRAGAQRSRIKTLRDLSRTLASLSTFNGRQVSPLTETFGVSREAMAIRLEELQLIAWT